jgi:mannitol-1-phosphate 5-dehydrogenase
MPSIVIFGAGNIGRSFIGQIFCRAGWDVVFVDVNEKIIALLNECRFYPVVIKEENHADETRRIGPVRAVNGRDIDAVAAEIAAADLAATSVGKAALDAILPVIARGLNKRCAENPRPLDIIIAENVRGAAEYFKTVLQAEAAGAFKNCGLVETSIGKMVPLMKAENLAADPLLLFAEKYETLIVDRRGFRGSVPAIPEIHAVENIAAFVDRKLFIHNLGHAAAAYLGYSAAPHLTGIAEVLAIAAVEQGVRAAMNEAAAALLKEYAGTFTSGDIAAHIDDLVSRFKNAALGDTVFRVGRDLTRKLAEGDRVAGAMRLCAKHSLPFSAIADVYHAALCFTATDENGRLFPGDEQFHREKPALLNLPGISSG